MPSVGAEGEVWYHEVTIELWAPEAAAIEEAAALLMGLGAEGLWWEDGQPSSAPFADDRKPPPGAMPFVRAYFADDGQWPAVAEALHRRWSESGLSGRLSLRRVAASGWETAWKRYYRPQRLPRQTWLVPAWYPERRLRPGEAVIRLDPGMAFGTGGHPTTRACLRLLARLPVQGARVLDLGSGSGVLALAAERWGAAEVVAVEPDPVAVKALCQNLRLNGSRRIQVAAKTWQEFLATPPPVSYDIVMANLSWRLIEPLLPVLPTVLAPSACAVVSGILAEDEPKLRTLLASAADGWRVKARHLAGGWLAVAVKR